MSEKCPECGGRGGHLAYEPGLFNTACGACKGTGVVEARPADARPADAVRRQAPHPADVPEGGPVAGREGA